jgi:hypothetical protein
MEGLSFRQMLHCAPQSLRLVVIAALVAGCSSKSPCVDPGGSACPATNAYSADDPRSVCHVCCESSGSSDAWTELSPTSTASTQFTGVASQTRPYSVQATFTAIQGSWNGNYFVFDDTTSNPTFSYHLFTRGQSHEGNLEIYFVTPLDGPIAAAGLNCTIGRN